ncbi:hypothetical protein Taro_043081, partial [Colocasia esculenta]|nr:hypothetical protein [Colocasia esculenta]
MRGYNNAKLVVQIDMEFRRPFGENTDDLVGEIARLVTQCASFDVPYWRDVPEDRKTKIYEKMLDKFELRVGDEVCNDIHIRKIIYEIAGRRYQDVRITLYRHYQSYATDEDCLQNPPEDINANEWAWLVNYFGCQKFKAMSERNKVNRFKQVISHITGRRSFKQVSWAEPKDALRTSGGSAAAGDIDAREGARRGRDADRARHPCSMGAVENRPPSLVTANVCTEEDTEDKGERVEENPVGRGVRREAIE